MLAVSLERNPISLDRIAFCNALQSPENTLSNKLTQLCAARINIDVETMEQLSIKLDAVTTTANAELTHITNLNTLLTDMSAIAKLVDTAISAAV